jgi:hypothetical protein
LNVHNFDFDILRLVRHVLLHCMFLDLLACGCSLASRVGRRVVDVFEALTHQYPRICG